VPSGWPSGWNVYYIVFVAGALSLVVPALLALLSYLFSARRDPAALRSSLAHRARAAEESNPSAPEKRTNPRAFIALSSALVLFAMALLILPCVVTLSSSPALGLISIVSVCSFAGLGLLYGIRKGDLDWLLSFNAEKSAENKPTNRHEAKP
jgi:NADH:ubiquinone oxidoreductase subunit 3 (subunit A)